MLAEIKVKYVCKDMASGASHFHSLQSIFATISADELPDGAVGKNWRLG